MTEKELKLLPIAGEVETSLAEPFKEIERIAFENTARVMDAFSEFRVSDSYFAGTTGYGYDDYGRDALDKIYARVFGAESALVRLGFVNGTHALTTALFAAVPPGTTLLSVTGAPYDTLRQAIGTEGLIDDDLIFLLLGKIVKAKDRIQLFIQLRHRHSFQFLCGCKAGHVGADLHLPLL